VKTTAAERAVKARHGVVCSLPDDFYGYFGWPTVCSLDDGTLAAAASGFRADHICPFGRTVICSSSDRGESWSPPRVVNDTPLDDRDAGLLALGGSELLLSWFTFDTRTKDVWSTRETRKPGARERYEAALDRITDSRVRTWLGSWLRFSADGGDSWEPPLRVPVTTPHGPIRLERGELLYLGKEYPGASGELPDAGQRIAAYGSFGRGRSWVRLGTVPLHPGTRVENYHEPHAVELPGGRLLGLIRLEEDRKTMNLRSRGLIDFSMMQTESTDGGRSWSPAVPLGFHGSPPHLLLHSGGTLVCVYGHRLEPYGQRAMISGDAGRSWEYDYVLRKDGFDWDLGYPSSVELENGSIFTVYYQKKDSAEEKCSLLWTRWELPG